jgi:hypothetical protein
VILKYIDKNKLLNSLNSPLKVPGNLARSKVSTIPSAGHSSDLKKSTELHRFFFSEENNKARDKKKKKKLYSSLKFPT